MVPAAVREYPSSSANIAECQRLLSHTYNRIEVKIPAVDASIRNPVSNGPSRWSERLDQPVQLTVHIELAN